MDKEYEKLAEVKESSKEIFDGKILHLFEDQVGLVNGKTASREVIRHIGAVCIIPVTDDNQVYVERQFRYPINQVITEIPAGKLDYKDENRLDAAKRELREETGLSAEKWTELGDFFPAAAYCDERITMYLAQGLSMGETDLDDDEFIDIQLVPLKQLVEEVMSGKIKDSKTQIAILKADKLLGDC